VETIYVLTAAARIKTVIRNHSALIWHKIKCRHHILGTESIVIIIIIIKTIQLQPLPWEWESNARHEALKTRENVDNNL